MAISREREQRPSLKNILELKGTPQMDIIIIDDEPVSLAMLKKLVGKLSDCRVEGFTRASAALAWCKVNNPDLVIVDYMMPELDGIEFTRRLRSLPGTTQTPVLMVTVKGDNEVRNSALQSGINDFLNKPFDFSELQVRVSNMLALRASQKQLADRVTLRADKVPARIKDTVRSEKMKPLLDVHMTLARLGGDEAALGEIAQVFIRTVPYLLSSMSSALSHDDFEHVLGQANSLKGAVAALEAPEVFNFVASVETHARNYDVTATVAAFAMTQTLVERLLIELEPFVPRDAQHIVQA
jgi:DNA-binding response OmpR family regulator